MFTQRSRLNPIFIRHVWLTLFSLSLVAFLSLGMIQNAASVSVAKNKPTKMQQLVQNNNVFTFELYGEIAAKSAGENLILSPFSISTALAMIYAGARGDTQTEMADVLHYDLGQPALHKKFSRLTKNLQHVGKTPYLGGQPFTLNIANGLWGHEDLAIEEAYRTLLDETYGAPLERLDFADSEATRQIINAWVAEHTNDKIVDILGPGDLQPETLLALANAIYFKATWREQFSTKSTQPQPFYPLDGSRIVVNMMRQKEFHRYMRGNGFQVVSLPYENGDDTGKRMAMLVIMPDEGNFEAFETSLTAKRFNRIIRGLSTYEVTLSLPRFSAATRSDMGEVLTTMGMPTPFSDEADFSGITSALPLKISRIIHQATIDVDEKGTEAAGATVITMLPGAGGDEGGYPTATMIVDHPFIYAIYDAQTSSVLFVGRVLNPTSIVE